MVLRDATPETERSRPTEPEGPTRSGVLRARVIPLSVFAFLVLAAALVWRHEVVRDRELVLAHTRDVSIQAARRLQILVDAELTAASVFARRWATHEKRDFSRRRFEEFAPVLVDELPGIVDVRLVGPDGDAGWRARPNVDSSWGQLGAGQGALIQAVRAVDRPVVSAPLDVGPGRTRFFAALPLRRDPEFLGTLVVEFDSASLIDDGFQDRIRSEFCFEVSDGDAFVYEHAADGRRYASPSAVAEQEFAIENRTWRLTMRPRESMAAGAGWLANLPILLFGLVLSAALSVLLDSVLRRMRLYRATRDHALSEIAQRKRAEEALRASEVRYRSVFDAVAEGLIVVGEDDRVEEANPIACEMHGYQPGGLDGMAVTDLIAEECRHLYHEFKAQRGQQHTAYLDSVHIHADGSRLEVAICACALRDGPVDRILIVVTDITERQRTIRRLAQLSRKIMIAQEEERARVSRELHDELGQLLTAARLELGLMRRQASSSGANLPDATAPAIRLVEEAAEELRRICRGLRPPVLDDIGLEPAVSQLVREFEERTSIDTELLVSLEDDEAPVSAEAALCVYRVLQESLNNVSRHSDAQRVMITLAASGRDITLKVSDDGRGFDAGDLDGVRGSGLEGMRERAGLAGGEIRIRSRPKSGTEIELRLPGALGAGG